MKCTAEFNTGKKKFSNATKNFSLISTYSFFLHTIELVSLEALQSTGSRLVIMKIHETNTTAETELSKME